MTPSRYLVIQCGGGWAIRNGNWTRGPFPGRVHAIDAAIDFAGKDGKAGRPAKGLAQEDGRTLRTIWTYGRDPYPSTPGNPANGRANGQGDRVKGLIARPHAERMESRGSIASEAVREADAMEAGDWREAAKPPSRPSINSG